MLSFLAYSNDFSKDTKNSFRLMDRVLGILHCSEFFNIELAEKHHFSIIRIYFGIFGLQDGNSGLSSLIVHLVG